MKWLKSLFSVDSPPAGVILAAPIPYISHKRTTIEDYCRYLMGRGRVLNKKMEPDSDDRSHYVISAVPKKLNVQKIPSDDGAVFLNPPVQLELTRIPRLVYISRLVLSEDEAYDDLAKVGNFYTAFASETGFASAFYTVGVTAPTFKVPGADRYFRDTENGKLEFRLYVDFGILEEPC